MQAPLEPFPFERQMARLARLLSHPAYEVDPAPEKPHLDAVHYNLRSDRYLWFWPLDRAPVRRVRTYGRGLIHGIVAGCGLVTAFSLCFLIVMG